MSADKPTIRVVSAEIQRDGHYLITQRKPSAVLPLLWEFPGGRVRDGETDRGALGRTAVARLGVEVRVADKVLEIEHDYDGYHLVLAVYRCAIASGEPAAVGVNAVAWVGADGFADYEFPGADQKTVDLLLSEG